MEMELSSFELGPFEILTKFLKTTRCYCSYDGVSVNYGISLTINVVVEKVEVLIGGRCEVGPRKIDW